MADHSYGQAEDRSTLPPEEEYTEQIEAMIAGAHEDPDVGCSPYDCCEAVRQLTPTAPTPYTFSEAEVARFEELQDTYTDQAIQIMPFHLDEDEEAEDTFPYNLYWEILARVTTVLVCRQLGEHVALPFYHWLTNEPYYLE